MTAQLRLDALSSGYVTDCPEYSICGRKIFRYRLANQEGIDTAHNAITNLMAQNTLLQLVNTIPAGQTLRDLVSNSRYLVINGNVFCFTNKAKAPLDIDLICRDIFFSDALIEEPVRCTRGHMFEKRFIARWIELRGEDCCPQGQHQVGEIEDDHLLKREIQDKINALAANTVKKNEIMTTLEKTAEEYNRQNCKLSAYSLTMNPLSITYSFTPPDQSLALAFYHIAQPSQLTHHSATNPITTLQLSQKVQLLKNIARETPIKDLNGAMERIPLVQLHEVLNELDFDQNKFNNMVEKFKLLIGEQNESNDKQVNYLWRIVEGLESLATYFLPDHPPGNMIEASQMITTTQMIASTLFYTFPWGIIGLGAYGSYKYLNKTKHLDISPAKNLTLDARSQKLTPLIGREEVISKVFTCWKSTHSGVRQHPLLVGPAGAGKSVIIHEIARRIALFGEKLNLPDSLKDSYLYSLTAAELLPADPYEGTQRFQKFFDNVRTFKDNAIVAIDEVHTFFNDTNLDKFGQLIKPILDTTSSSIPFMIFATTRREYEKYMNNDESIARRFHVIPVDILDKKSTIAALKQHIMIQFPVLKYNSENLDYVYEKSNTLTAKSAKFKQPEISKQVLSRAISKIQTEMETPPSITQFDAKNREIEEQVSLLNRADLQVTDEETRVISKIKRLKLERTDIEETIREEKDKLQLFKTLVDKIYEGFNRVFYFSEKKRMYQPLTESDEKEFKFITNILIKELISINENLEREFKVKPLSKEMIDVVITEIEASLVGAQ